MWGLGSPSGGLSVCLSCGHTWSTGDKMAPTTSWARLLRSSPRPWRPGGIWSVGSVRRLDADGDEDSILARSAFAPLVRGIAGEGESVALPEDGLRNPQRPCVDSAGLFGSSCEGRGMGGRKVGSVSGRGRGATARRARNPEPLGRDSSRAFRCGGEARDIVRSLSSVLPKSRFGLKVGLGRCRRSGVHPGRKGSLRQTVRTCATIAAMSSNSVVRDSQMS